jgi:fumarate hydratase class II
VLCVFGYSYIPKRGIFPKDADLTTSASALSKGTTRTEWDSFGAIEVDAVHWWGAQTQRSLHYFAISNERMPEALITALAKVKRACAIVNRDLGKLSIQKASAITQAADEIIAGQWFSEFPLSVWQTGSGTQTNMNMNEVLANRGSALMGGAVGKDRLLHPNDDVNMGQSSNDVFPTCMHIAIAIAMRCQLLPALRQLRNTLESKSDKFKAIIKTGRTHLQDATPLTLGQEFSAYVAQLSFVEKNLITALPDVLSLAIGGTAVGTGLNTHVEFGPRVAAVLSEPGGLTFSSAANKFAALASHEALYASHAALKTLACALLKIANDLRWLASGPRCGLGEIQLPENEPGSSIMPGKVNPTQSEALMMACYQVIANDVAITASTGLSNFELHVGKPLIAHAHLQSLRLLTDGMHSFELHALHGITVNQDRIEQQLNDSLMLVTALVPHIGYDKATRIARHAFAENISLREAAQMLEAITEEDFQRWVNPAAMTLPDS